MQAIGFTADKTLRYLNCEKPVARGQDILVRVKAVGINPVDEKIRSRVTPASGEQQILGWDAAGIVEAIGDQVQDFQPGDEVWYAGAINRPGCFSQWHLVDQRIVSHKPQSLTFNAAAAMPLTSITAWELLFDRFGASSDSEGYLLVIGGAGGVGSMLIQLAKKLTGLKVIATASRPESCAWVERMGADIIVDHSQPLDVELKKLGIGAVPLVASLTHTEQHLPSIVELIAPQGKLGVIDDPSALDIMPFKRKCVSVHWEFMFTRSLFNTSDIKQQKKILHQVAAAVDNGLLQSTLAQDLGPMTPEVVTQALSEVASGRMLGKLVMAGIEIE
ncbi:zinc-binding alcohol dehydrogenase family protein [Gilvimarinus agarilyticus]|uniref:zinc-binding alcohol dehydrogenase family protein n=1 Tax=Gilvimarinus sp. 2_MG-2023 TaxID=3062666 RepID=UPI001C092362|nr:zinc-binding alcohol dehydrogenase family protein [Gilvimarinus sp. 2_MG-2023]MBU2884415.1 zinc-binding alcohol dehydrogenase family protein [Gilvimarinus agarilyticus]MDO6569551.1 zinc-binding alcohol dehydrogenase family protein [Gilvimarinus sp. 2_MG-2023]